MLIPLPWLKEYIKVTSKLTDLMWKLTELGITCESYKKINGETVLDVEVTPNRPDLLSIIGVAREVSVFEKGELKLPNIPEVKNPSRDLPIEVKVDSKLTGRYSAITVAGVNVKPSPKKIQERLKLMGLKPINNIVDITNYAMFEMGIPIHAFDYDKFESNKLNVELAKGGESFTSVDGVSYELPKDALIIKDIDRVVDLAGIKGGENTGIDSTTKNLFIHVPIYDPVIIRKNSQQMKLASDASYIYERGPDLGGTVNVLRRTLDLILKYAEGEVASELIDYKSKEYKPKPLSLATDRLTGVLGINISDNQIMQILSKLHLNPNISNNKITCTVPTYRSDLNIQEDLIEEIARVYGYNNLPKTMPRGSVNTTSIPYEYDNSFEIFLKNLMVSANYFETSTLALTSQDSIKKSQLNLDNHIQIANPVSLGYEYLRTSIIPRLMEAVKINSDENKLKLFEYNKVYFGPLDKSVEPHTLSAIIKGGEYTDIKGVVDILFQRLNISKFSIKSTAAKKGLWHPKRSGVIEIQKDILGTIGELNPTVLQNFDIKEKLFAMELDIDTIKKHSNKTVFKSLPKYPAQIEDITLSVRKEVGVGDLITSIKSTSKYVNRVEMIDTYKDTFTFRIWYQNPNKTMTDKEVKSVRKALLKKVKVRFGANLDY